MYTVILLRHGESEWNSENRFTGWTDIDLSDTGVAEAHAAAEMLRSAGLKYSAIFTSYLRRAIRTASIVAENTDRLWVPVYKSWRLNERHYGALQGLNKKETAEKYGVEQVEQWRRSYAVRPPLLQIDDARWPGREEKYAGIEPKDIPLGESLADTVKRVLPYWKETIVPALAAGVLPLISAHGNSLRALVMHLDNMSESEIALLNIPTGIPLLYELDDNFKPAGKKYLADETALLHAVEKVKAQGKVKKKI